MRKTCRVSGIESEPSDGLQGWSTHRAERRDVETDVFLSFASQLTIAEGHQRVS